MSDPLGEFPKPSPPPAPTTTNLSGFEERVEHRYAENESVKIHYAALGDGPLIVMLHGFPDYWYTWRHQMAALSGQYRVAALDLRGYNLSDKPDSIEGYGMNALLGDVAAVIRAEVHEKAVIVGHDWGGAISWQFATRLPEMTERLIVLNLPHLSGLTRELAHNPDQRQASAYTRFFQREGAHEMISAEKLARWVSDPETRERYVEAFER
ncbi:MAG TPA: alpha/beta hydrolase, partial [Rubrobacteraceae bacterium]|nr:alpha/beta hydrolase [Rubrobacteraceae bacterium]